MKFSLIVATLNRKDELEKLFLSLCRQTFRSFEVIIVDQNSDLIDDIVAVYEKHLDIVHIKIFERGLSKARNIGLQYANGEILGFPDDDCEYSDELLMDIHKKFVTHNHEIVSCRIVNKLTNANIGISWPDHVLSISRDNLFKTCMSASFFIKNKNNSKIIFDEEFGIGSVYGSAEESDYILRALLSGYRGVYYPDTKIFHPEMINDYSHANLSKAYNYSLGLGGFYKKHYYNFSLASVIYVLTVKPIGGMLCNVFMPRKFRYYFNILRGRISGFIRYK